MRLIYFVLELSSNFLVFLQPDLGIRRLLERLNAAVLLAATTRERRLRGDSNSVEIKDVTVEPTEPVITPTGLYKDLTKEHYLNQNISCLKNNSNYENENELLLGQMRLLGHFSSSLNVYMNDFLCSTVWRRW